MTIRGTPPHPRGIPQAVTDKDATANLHLVQSAPTLRGLVGNRFRLDRPKERVPLGRRYRSIDDRLGTRAIALVLSVRMSPDHADPWCERRFVEAAEYAQEISLKGAIPIRAIELFEYEGMHHVVIIEDDPGVPSLQERLEQGPMDRAEADHLLRKVATLVQQAHELGMLHLDLNPQQVFEAKDGTVRLSGFALRGAFQADVAPDMPERGSYLAPELRTGGSLSAATDVYALGRLYQAMLCGVTRGAPQMTPLPEDADSIVRRCTRLEADKRYVSVKDFIAALDGEYTHDPMSGRPWQATPVMPTQRRALTPTPRLGPPKQPTPTPAPPQVASEEEDEPRRSMLPWILVGVLLFLLLFTVAGIFALGPLFAGSEPAVDPEPAAAEVDDAPPDLTPRPAPPVTIDSDPPGAMVYEADVPLGETPLEIRAVTNGVERILTLRHDGHRDSVFVLGDQAAGEITVALEALASEPADAEPAPAAAPAPAVRRRPRRPAKPQTGRSDDPPLMLER